MINKLSPSVKKLFTKKNKFIYIRVNYEEEKVWQQIEGFIKIAVEKDFDDIRIKQNKRVNVLYGHRVLTLSAEKK
jgi:hypothetical protein